MKKLAEVQSKAAKDRGLLKSVLLTLVISAVFIAGIYYLGNIGNEQGIMLTREAVTRTVVECYAIEGIYPPNVEYMEENYNFTYDKTKYYIHYDVFASNIMPTIEVYEKR